MVKTLCSLQETENPMEGIALPVTTIFSCNSCLCKFGQIDEFYTRSETECGNDTILCVRL